MLNRIVTEIEEVETGARSKRDADFTPNPHLKTRLNALNENLAFISGGRNHDAVFNEKKLIDNFSFDIFKKDSVNIPVILITHENHFIMTIIEINNEEFVSKSESNIQQTTLLNIDNLQKLLSNQVFEERKKTRLLVKRGITHIALLLTDISVIYTKNKLVYVVDRESKKYSIDKTLSELGDELEGHIFFRANRQYIININFVKSFKGYKKVKLLVDMNIPGLEEPVIISQHVAPAFKKWMEDA